MVTLSVDSVASSGMEANLLDPTTLIVAESSLGTGTLTRIGVGFIADLIPLKGFI